MSTGLPLGGSRAGLIIETPYGERQENELKFQLKASNNKAAYEALIVRVELCCAVSAKEVHPSWIHSSLSVSLIESTKLRTITSRPMYIKSVRQLVT